MSSKNSYRKTTERIDELVDRFVEKINTSYREPVLIEDSPASVLVGVPDEYGFSDWQIKLYADIHWIDALESKLGMALPYALRSLVGRYVFPSFDAMGIFFFANTPEGTDFHELRTRLFHDEALCPPLLMHRYLQFAQPDGANYDPVCFDMNHGSGIDGAIVLIDHEDILCNSIVKVTEEIAPSLTSMLERCISVHGR